MKFSLMHIMSRDWRHRHKFKISIILNFRNSNHAYKISTFFSLNGKLTLVILKVNEKCYYNLPNSAFLGRLSLKSQPQNPEFRNNPENLFDYLPPINNLSVIKGQVFLGCRINVSCSRTQLSDPRSQVKPSTTEPLRSPFHSCDCRFMKNKCFFQNKVHVRKCIENTKKSLYIQ